MTGLGEDACDEERSLLEWEITLKEQTNLKRLVG